MGIFTWDAGEFADFPLPLILLELMMMMMRNYTENDCAVLCRPQILKEIKVYIITLGGRLMFSFTELLVFIYCNILTLTKTQIAWGLGLYVIQLTIHSECIFLF